MKNFVQIASGIDPRPMLLELTRNRDMWNSNTTRTAPELSAHRGVDDLLLRYTPYEESQDYVSAVCAEIHATALPPWFLLTEAQSFVLALFAKVKGTHLGRVMFASLAPGQTIPWHSDLIPQAVEKHPERIQPPEYYDRYHFVLQSDPACLFRCGEETVHMAVGEVWWFDNLTAHSVENFGNDQRIHLIMDIHHDRA